MAQALALPSSQALLAGLAADNARAGFMAVNASVQSLGQAVGPLLAGISFGLWGMQGVFWATAGFSLITLVLFNLLLLPKPERPTPELQKATAAQTPPVITPVTLPVYELSSQFPTILQLYSAKLIHFPTNQTMEIPNTQVLISIGKPIASLLPDIDVSQFPHAGVVSQRHATIRIERDTYYIQDMGSSNGTYLNQYPLLPGNWYKLRSGDRIDLGKGNLVTFLFEISAPELK